jgi:hypothetical protein
MPRDAPIANSVDADEDGLGAAIVLFEAGEVGRAYGALLAACANAVANGDALAEIAVVAGQMAAFLTRNERSRFDELHSWAAARSMRLAR